jgi:hypothetical protein
VPEADHERSLTRQEVTPAVHYVRFHFTEPEVARFAAARVALVADHPEYPARTELTGATRDELLGDLTGRSVPIALA